LDEREREASWQGRKKQDIFKKKFEKKHCDRALAWSADTCLTCEGNMRLSIPDVHDNWNYTFSQ
jgi:hypothetical protein